VVSTLYDLNRNVTGLFEPGREFQSFVHGETVGSRNLIADNGRPRVGDLFGSSVHARRSEFGHGVSRKEWAIKMLLNRPALYNAEIAISPALPKLSKSTTQSCGGRGDYFRLSRILQAGASAIG
jgi:hypothetical protein